MAQGGKRGLIVGAVIGGALLGLLIIILVPMSFSYLDFNEVIILKMLKYD